MTKFRFLLALVLLCGVCGMAKADPLDFKARVQDPPPTSLPTYDITSTSFDFTFGACPTYITDATGCFLGINDTGATITDLTLTFENSTDPSDPTNTTQYLNGQPVSCDTSESGTLFSSAACSLNAAETLYTLDFSGGTGIANTEFFIIAEDGPDPSAFGTGNAAATLAATPEPGSVVLLSTGVAALGFLVIRRRQDGVSLNWRA